MEMSWKLSAEVVFVCEYAQLVFVDVAKVEKLQIFQNGVCVVQCDRLLSLKD